MVGLTTKNKIIFGTAFVSLNVFCTWIILQIGGMV